MANPTWATPTNEMDDEELRFAIEAEGILEFRRLGFTKQQHVVCFKPRNQEQAAKDWDEVESRLGV